MIFLQSIWMLAVVLIMVAIGLWVALLFIHVLAMRRDRRGVVYTDIWMDILLDFLDGSQPPEILPLPKSQEETEVVISLLKDLAERFSGAYGDRMLLVLERIRAVDYGLRLLRSRSNNDKVQGCALLGLCGASEEVDLALERALDSRDARVVLEAASALVHRGRVRDIANIVHALCRSRASKSLLAHDLLRRWGEAESSDWSGLLNSEWQDDGLILLLDAAGSSGRSEWTDLIIKQAHHDSPQVLKAVLSALESLGHPQGVLIAQEACVNANAQVRMQAVRTLEVCGDLANSYDSLRKLLLDESFEVRRVALDVILKLGGRSYLVQMAPVDYWQNELFRESGLLASQ